MTRSAIASSAGEYKSSTGRRGWPRYWTNSTSLPSLWPEC